MLGVLAAVACSEQATIDCVSVRHPVMTAPVRLTTKPFVMTPEPPLRAPGPPVQLRVAMPPGTRCVAGGDTTRAFDIVPGTLNGNPIRLSGVLYTNDGVRHELNAFTGESRCQEIALNVDLPLDTSRRVIRFELAAAEPVDVPQIEWWSGDLCLDPRRSSVH
jgi:hypothetical protein